MAIYRPPATLTRRQPSSSGQPASSLRKARYSSLLTREPSEIQEECAHEGERPNHDAEVNVISTFRQSGIKCPGAESREKHYGYSLQVSPSLLLQAPLPFKCVASRSVSELIGVKAKKAALGTLPAPKNNPPNQLQIALQVSANRKIRVLRVHRGTSLSTDGSSKNDNGFPRAGSTTQ